MIRRYSHQVYYFKIAKNLIIAYYKTGYRISWTCLGLTVKSWTISFFNCNFFITHDFVNFPYSVCRFSGSSVLLFNCIHSMSRI